MLEAYRQHVADRAAQNIPPAPLSPEQVADLVELLKDPPADEEAFLVERRHTFCEMAGSANRSP